jgi:two-component system response regulator YesN|uniref:helix-turn-helix domain-containing protein n=1 Tax=Waltera acetigignens TaxID=2981769 RepID=UPI003F8218F0
MNIKKICQNAVFRFLISYLLVLVVPMLIVSMGFQVAFRIVENNLKVTHINMLQRSADAIENELLDIETMALQVANANSILDMASQSRGDENYIMTALDALKDFTLYLNYQDIELMKSKSAYIYFRNTDLVMFEKSYYRPEIFKSYLETWSISYEDWQEKMQDPELVAPAFCRMGEGFAYVFPFSKRMFGERQGVIVCQIDEDKLFEKMRFINNLDSQETYLVEILDASGEQLWVSNTLEQFPSLEPEELRAGYLEKEGLSIIVAHSETLNWYYVLALPVQESLAELAALKNTVLLLMVAAALGSMVLSLMQAVKKGKPVEEALQALTPEGEAREYANLGTAVSGMVKRHEDILEEAEKNRPRLQKNFFDELLNADFSTEVQLRTEAEKLGVDIDNQIYQTAYVQLFSENDFSTVDAQTINEIKILSRLMKTHMWERCGHNVWFHKKNYNSEIAIFAIDHMEEDVIDFIQETMDWMRQECQVEISSGIGGTCNNLLLIWRSMEEAAIALENCTRENPVIGYHADLVNSSEYYFPAIAEEKLKECLSAGQWQETKDILTLLETENCRNRSLRRSQFIKLNRRIMDLLGQVWKQEELKEKAFWLNEVFMQPEIAGEEYFRRLRQLCRKICNDNVEKKQEQRGLLVEEIKEYIREHYCEPDMGLSRVGGEFRMSESYLSTLFKEQSGGNFADYVEALRIERACELLQNTDNTVNDVADAVGYNSVQSFRRAFKRVKGVSPKEVRV